jgi:hypothetical protein
VTRVRKKEAARFSFRPPAEWPSLPQVPASGPARLSHVEVPSTFRKSAWNSRFGVPPRTSLASEDKDAKPSG